MNDINLKSFQFKNNICNIINSSDLPISIIYYIFQSIFNQIEKNYIGTINHLTFEESIKEKKTENTKEID